MKHKLINSKTKQEVQIGDIVTDFRGGKSKVEDFAAPKHSASTGRIYTEHGAFFPSVYGCEIVAA